MARGEKERGRLLKTRQLVRFSEGEVSTDNIMRKKIARDAGI